MWYVGLVYSDVKSAVTKTTFSGSSRKDLRSCKKCLLSWMYEGSTSTRGFRKWAT